MLRSSILKSYPRLSDGHNIITRVIIKKVKLGEGQVTTKARVWREKKIETMRHVGSF